MQATEVTPFLHGAHIFASAVEGALERAPLRDASNLPLNPANIWMLRLVDRRAGIRIREIAHSTGTSQAAASKSVDKLVRLGLIARQVHQSDRRSAFLSLTLRGRSLLHRFELLQRERFLDLLAEFPSSEVETLIGLLGRVVSLAVQDAEGPDGVCARCRTYCVRTCPLRNRFESCLCSGWDDER